MKTDQKNRVRIFDTTLRDGEQCPGASMNTAEKLEVARQLARLKVDVIEAGFPIASPGDFDAVHAVATQIRGPLICGLARCLEADISRCAEAVAPAGKKGRIHVFLATSAIHRKYKLRKAKAEIIRQAVAGVTFARRFVDDVEFSPEDASRTEPDFLAEVVRAVADAGASTINIPDTVGYAIPSQFGDLISGLFSRVPGLDRLVVNVHCHNDLGLAVANSIAAIEAGARGVECTINGLGERAGNCSLEELVMALRTRSDAFGVTTGVNPREIYRTSRMVSRITGMVVQRNKAIVGANAFAHEAGIHQDGLLKNRKTYEIMKPEDIGVPGSELVLGKHSGRHALRTHLDRMGLKLSDKDFDQVYGQFIALADKKKTIYDDDLFALVQDRIQDVPQFYALDYLHVSAGSTTIATATVCLRRDREVIRDAACGSGPVDAALKSVDRISGTPGRLLDYSLQAITQGQDALGEVSVRVAFGPENVISAKASSTDIVEASVKAYLNALNRHLYAVGERPGKKTKT
ncbi:MAG: 2-isopropylmalate synthase [Kiritimatiellia bacterium]|nr:2-isopropylmalate synthase [Kiritimatiellia bacterium]